MRTALSRLLLAAGLGLLVADPASATGRDCAAAGTQIDQAVCDSERLIRLDAHAGRLYGWLWVALDDRDRTALRDEQHAFLARRDACGAEPACLRAAYLSRLDTLSEQLRRIVLARHHP